MFNTFLFLKRLDSEQRLIEEQALRQSAAKLTIDKNNQVGWFFSIRSNQSLHPSIHTSITSIAYRTVKNIYFTQEDRIIEAKNDKIRYLEEVHLAQRKVTDLQTHLKVLESKLAEKDTEIRLMQEKKSKFVKFKNMLTTSG